MNAPQLKATASNGRGRLEIYDDLGPSWAGMIDAKAVAAELKKLGNVETIDVHINSPGGSAWEGLAIASILRDHPARVEIVVEGIAASAASLIVMIGDRVRIPVNALLMIHDPWIMVMGGEAALAAAQAQLASVKKASIALYTNRSGKSADEIAALMKAETWYTGDEAVAAGFADETLAGVSTRASVARARFGPMFQRAPASLDAFLEMPSDWIEPAEPAAQPYIVGSEEWLTPKASAL